MATVEIFELKKMDLKNAVIIDGFPSVGLVSSIVANYLIALLKMADRGMARLIKVQKDVLKKKSILFMAYGYKDRPNPGT